MNTRPTSLGRMKWRPEVGLGTRLIGARQTMTILRIPRNDYHYSNNTTQHSMQRVTAAEQLTLTQPDLNQPETTFPIANARDKQPTNDDDASDMVNEQRILNE